MNVVKLWFSPSGRASRSDLWLRTYLAFAAISIVAGVIDGLIDQELFSSIVGLLAIWVFVVVQIKRCHDRDRSGWFILLCLIPIVNLWPLIEICFLKGTTGPNRFGEDPIADPSFEDDRNRELS